MKTSLSNQNTSTEIMKMIEGLESLNNDDVKALYDVDSVKEAETLLNEEYEEAVESESYYNGMSDFQSHGFSGAYDYNSYRF